MPQKEAYLIRRTTDGTFRTVQAYSPRSAMLRFIAEYEPPEGEIFEVKVRSHGDWEAFKVTGSRRKR